MKSPSGEGPSEGGQGGEAESDQSETRRLGDGDGSMTRVRHQVSEPIRTGAQSNFPAFGRRAAKIVLLGGGLAKPNIVALAGS